MAKVFSFILLCALGFAPTLVWAQFSVTAQGGFVIDLDKDDPYALDKPWPSSSNLGGSNSLVFLQGATGGVGSFSVAWEASKIFSIAAVYRSLSFSTSTSDRNAQVSNLGIQLKFNFIRNTQPIVPFIQVEYMFSNSSKLS